MKRWICGLCALAMLLGLLQTAHARPQWTEERFSRALAALKSGEADPILPQERIIVSKGELDEAKKLDESWMHILLISSSAPSMKENYGRTSMMMLLSIHTGSMEMRLTKLPASALLPVEGLPGPVPLRYINCFGGPGLVMQSLNRALGLNIKKYCAVNEAAFSRAVETLGGVQLDLTDAERAALKLPEGECRLNGEAALRFVRLSLEDAGAGRALRLIQNAYRQFLEEFSLKTAIRLARDILPLIDTNLSLWDMMDLAYSLFSSDGSLSLSLHSVSADANGQLGEAARAAIHMNIYGVTTP